MLKIQPQILLVDYGLRLAKQLIHYLAYILLREEIPGFPQNTHSRLVLRVPQAIFFSLTIDIIEYKYIYFH